MTNFDQHNQIVGNQFNADQINFYPQRSYFPEDDAAIALAQRKFLGLSLDEIPEIATLPPGSHMPIDHNREFVGRKESLKGLATVLKSSDALVINRVETVVLSGMGGVGKTQLASEFVHRYGQYFAGGVYWLNFTNADTAQTEIASCGSMLDLETYSNFNSQSLHDKARLVLSTWETALPRLLVFDNCQDEELFTQWKPRTGNCRIIITSLRPNWSSELGVKVLPLGCLKREESIVLLCKQREDIPTDNLHIDAIADELGDLPLALHMASRFLKKYRHASIGSPESYLAQLQEKKRLQHPSLQAPGVTPITKHIQNVEATFAMAFDLLKTEDPNDLLAIKLLIRAVYFAPNIPIPRDILRMTLKPNGYDTDMELLAENALEQLLSLCLLESLENGALRLHRLIADFVIIQVDKFDTKAQSDVELVMLIASIYQTRAGYQSHILALLPHLRVVTSLAESRNDIAAANLCNALGYYLLSVGAYSESQLYSEKALAINEQISEPDHASIVNTLNNLTECYIIQSKYDQAEQESKRALTICNNILGPKHLLTSDSLRNSARICLHLGEFTKAEKLIRRSLDIRKLQPGKSQLDEAINFVDLAFALKAHGQFEKAESYLHKALSIFKKELGENHSRVIGCLIELASCYCALGKYSKAEELFNKALVIQEQELGENHPDRAFSFNSLANCYSKQGKYAEAEPLYKKAGNILEQWFDIASPEMDKSIRNLLENYIAQEKFTQAEPLFFQLLENGERKFGPEHPLVAKCLEDLADFNYSQEKYVQAKGFWKRALEIYKRVGSAGRFYSDIIRVTSRLEMVKQQK